MSTILYGAFAMVSPIVHTWYIDTTTGAQLEQLTLYGMSQIQIARFPLSKMLTTSTVVSVQKLIWLRSDCSRLSVSTASIIFQFRLMSCSRFEPPSRESSSDPSSIHSPIYYNMKISWVGKKTMAKETNVPDCRVTDRSAVLQFDCVRRMSVNFHRQYRS